MAFELFYINFTDEIFKQNITNLTNKQQRLATKWNKSNPYTSLKDSISMSNNCFVKLLSTQQKVKIYDTPLSTLRSSLGGFKCVSVNILLQ